MYENNLEGFCTFMGMPKSFRIGNIENYFHLHHSQPYYFKSSLGYYFDRLVKMHATPKSLELCDKLQDFTFTPHPKYRPSRGLIKACSEVICQRAKDAKRVVYEALSNHN
ncbi:hypothetical protein NHP190002_05820 [Helicobacter ailurogastricus]|uniref:hypothetical protein n=1 Tax=Helicobacter ailurogastricus TaxID=1578720 RepID=UPI00244D7EC7|nr:hypothetical protein [Helicobacter ailurogastricus]GMB89903.1 hypothetical protein NHP190002_05820 [Helicobacter ailurogastricus]